MKKVQLHPIIKKREESILMTLEEFKKKVEENLLKAVGKESAQRIMKDYENDFPRFLEENWTVEAITPALIGYYI